MSAVNSVNSVNSVSFITPGSIDPVAITTLGINAKGEAPLGASSTGFFGTGLKYAIAALLRNNQSITIDSNNRTYSFSTEPVTVRDKHFNVVVMTDTDYTKALHAPGGCPKISRNRLGFTTELGKTWELWMAYRELESNTRDEGGFTTTETETGFYIGQWQMGKTIITVTGPAFFSIHSNRHQWFLDPASLGPPIDADTNVEVYPRPAPGIFYRGILVSASPTLYTYNFLRDVELTEDRTAANIWSLRYRLAELVIKSTDEKWIRTFATAPKDSWEHTNLHVSNAYSKPSEVFTRTVGKLWHDRHPNLTDDASITYLRRRPVEQVRELTLTKLDKVMLQRALRAVAVLGVTVTDTPIVVTETLGKDVLGEAKDGKIFLSRRAFTQGTKMLAGTIYEEWIHLTHGHSDTSRSMQNYLIDKTMSLVEELLGEPI